MFSWLLSLSLDYGIIGIFNFFFIHFCIFPVSYNDHFILQYKFNYSKTDNDAKYLVIKLLERDLYPETNFLKERAPPLPFIGECKCRMNFYQNGIGTNSKCMKNTIA